MSFRKSPLAFAQKQPSQKDSWWTRPQMQTDRAAFSAQIASDVQARMNKLSSRYSHDKFPGKQKHPR